MSELQAEASSRPGQLTSIMRAAPLSAPHGARCPAEGVEGLRVALVVDGKVVDERTFTEPVSVTLGHTERDTFVIVDDTLRGRITLFEPAHGAGFELVIPEAVDGRIAVDGELSSTADLRGRSLDRLRVSTGMKGRLSFGRSAILFSYGPLPRRVVSAGLAPAMKREIGIDWTTLMVAAVSFLFHFGALGAIYSDWADPLQDDGLTIARIVETVRELPAVPPVEEPDQQPSETAASSVTKSTKDLSEKKASPVSGARVSAHTPRSSSINDREASNLSSELAGLDMKMLVGLNPSGVNTNVVLEQGTMPAALLNQAALDGRASGRPGQLNMGPNAGFDFGGPRDLATLGNDGHGDKDHGPGTAQSASARPKASIDAPTPPKGPEQIPGLEGVIGSLQGGFRRCYQAGLDHENPDMAGGARVTVKIGGNGDVMSASPSVSGNLSPGVVSCMVRKITGAQFPKTPSGSPAVFVVPITVKKQ
jgi:hypothetical protein